MALRCMFLRLILIVGWLLFFVSFSVALGMRVLLDLSVTQRLVLGHFLVLWMESW